MSERIKDPNKVRAGQARQRQLRDQLGEQGYIAYQQARYIDALVAHPDLPQQGFAGLARKLGGRGEAIQFLRDLHEQQRLERLDRPTPGEAAVRALLTALGFQVHLLRQRFDYRQWRCEPLDCVLGERDAIAEGGVGPFFCDVLLPVRRIAIEVHGGCHINRRASDMRRRAYLEAQGLTVVTLTEDVALAVSIARCHLIYALTPLQLPLSIIADDAQRVCACDHQEKGVTDGALHMGRPTDR